MSVSGRVIWPPEAPIWTFVWEVIDGHSEAIAFRDVYFRGNKVFHKASLPMIRVHYDSGAGPYKDSLSIRNMQGPVKVYEHNQSGFRHLAVESYHKIGRYHLINRWFFRSDGIIMPQLHSAGLQHPSGHRHHVYWRFDFDIDGAANNLTLVQTGGSVDFGYGPGWQPKPYEGLEVRASASGYAVLNKHTNRRYLIELGPNDEPGDYFEIADMYVAAYHAEEDLKGRQGNALSAEMWQHVNGENIDGKDVVFWYIAHLHHHYPSPESDWHVCGPILRPSGY
jgi:Cu2+-containing amine oxidase